MHQHQFQIDTNIISPESPPISGSQRFRLSFNRTAVVLDITFREDDCRVRKDHAPHNFAALRKFALALLRQDNQYPKRSLRSRRKTAERLPDYRASLLGLCPQG